MNKETFIIARLTKAVKNNISHNLRQSIAVSDQNKIDETLCVPFLIKNQKKIEIISSVLKENSLIAFPEEVLLSVAIIRVAFSEYLKFVEHEYTPNFEDLKDFTGDLITDKDIENYFLFNNQFVSMEEVVTNDMGEKDTLDETIDNGDYSRMELEDILYESLYHLDQEEKELLINKFGLDGHDEHDIHQLADIFHISEDEVKRKTTAALNNLRHLMETMM